MPSSSVTSAYTFVKSDISRLSVYILLDANLHLSRVNFRSEGKLPYKVFLNFSVISRTHFPGVLRHKIHQTMSLYKVQYSLQKSTGSTMGSGTAPYTFKCLALKLSERSKCYQQVDCMNNRSNSNHVINVSLTIKPCFNWHKWQFLKMKPTWAARHYASKLRLSL